jgi:hypothetical protein
MKHHAWFIVFLASIIALIALFGTFLGPHILGDSPSYLQTMKVLAGDAPSAGFMPNRVITTFGAMELIRALSVPLGGVLNAWFFLNCLLFIFATALFYELLVSMFESRTTAFLGTLFLAGNYGFLIFGLNYLMDIGGWSFYIFSIYFLYRYSRSKSIRDLSVSALLVGVGGLFKEYAFLAAPAIGTYLIIESWPSLKSWSGWKGLSAKAALTASSALVPAIILYVWAYSHFGYTYADWFGANASHYVYASRIKEYIKALGSLVNVLAFVFIGGAWIVAQKWRGMSRELKALLAAIAVSFLPVFVWPAITQRILTITVPFIAIVSCFMFKRFERRWYVFLPILVLYILATFFMDSYLLNAVNLPF